MDRYIIREKRTNATQQEHLVGNQMIAFSPTSTGRNNITMYSHPNIDGMDQHRNMGGNYQPPHNTNQVPAYGNNIQQDPMNISSYYPSTSGTRTTYAENNSGLNSTDKQMQIQTNSIQNIKFGCEYQSRSLVGAQKSVNKAYLHRPSVAGPSYAETKYQPQPNQRTVRGDTRTTFQNTPNNPDILPSPLKPSTSNVEIVSKSEEAVQKKTRSEILKKIFKSGPRVFSGPVEKVLKWHKSLQEIGVLVLYEIVAKCVNVRPTETCAKNLVVRDENGPAMQVVYYEIDFLMPEIRPPCTVRVIGKMVAGANRLQAFNVRLATGDDVATLPRRAAVSAHHVYNLCEEYGS